MTKTCKEEGSEEERKRKEQLGSEAKEKKNPSFY